MIDSRPSFVVPLLFCLAPERKYPGLRKGRKGWVGEEGEINRKLANQAQVVVNEVRVRGETPKRLIVLDIRLSKESSNLILDSTYIWSHPIPAPPVLLLFLDHLCMSTR